MKKIAMFLLAIIVITSVFPCVVAETLKIDDIEIAILKTKADMAVKEYIKNYFYKSIDYVELDDHISFENERYKITFKYIIDYQPKGGLTGIIEQFDVYSFYNPETDAWGNFFINKTVQNCYPDEIILGTIIVNKDKNDNSTRNNGNDESLLLSIEVVDINTKYSVITLNVAASGYIAANKIDINGQIICPYTIKYQNKSLFKDSIETISIYLGQYNNSEFDLLLRREDYKDATGSMCYPTECSIESYGAGRETVKVFLDWNVYEKEEKNTYETWFDFN